VSSGPVIDLMTRTTMTIASTSPIATRTRSTTIQRVTAAFAASRVDVTSADSLSTTALRLASSFVDASRLSTVMTFTPAVTLPDRTSERTFWVKTS